MTFRPLRSFLLAALLLTGVEAHSQEAAPIRLGVDASNVAQKVIHCREKIPVQPGPLMLYYPKWLPGDHSPSGPILNVVNPAVDRVMISIGATDPAPTVGLTSLEGTNK